MGIDEKAEIKVPAHDRVPPHQAAAEKIAATGKGGGEAGAEIFQFPTKAVQRSMEQFSNMFGLAGHGTKIEEAVHRSTRNLDEWYTALGVKPGEKYYLKPEERVRLW